MQEDTEQEEDEEAEEEEEDEEVEDNPEDYYESKWKRKKGKENRKERKRRKRLKLQEQVRVSRRNSLTLNHRSIFVVNHFVNYIFPDIHNGGRVRLRRQVERVLPTKRVRHGEHGRAWRPLLEAEAARLLRQEERPRRVCCRQEGEAV